jgi:hypothetical protein
MSGLRAAESARDVKDRVRSLGMSLKLSHGSIGWLDEELDTAPFGFALHVVHDG